MNSDVLTNKLTEVISELPETPQVTVSLFDSVSSESVPYYQIALENIKDITQYLQSSETVSEVFDDKMLNTGSGASRVNLELLARWLVRQAQVSSPELATQKLADFLDSQFTSGKNVLAISGVTVQDVVHITNKIKLIPFDELQASHAKEAISPPYMKPEFAMKLGFAPAIGSGYKPPEAAAVVDTEISPKAFGEEKHPRAQDFLPLYEFCEFLTLVKSGTPIPVASWSDVSNDTPCKQFLGGGWSGQVIDIISRSSILLTQQEWDSHKDLYLKFCALPQSVRDLLRVPIERLNQARRRSDAADKAIDLGVAFEALLLNDKSHKEQIAFTLRLRAALFLGSEFTKRQELINFFSSIYSCRSQAAHTGKLDAKIKVAHRGRVEAKKLLQEGDEYCVEAIIKIINLGKFPDWNELMLK
ncbi:hypothetical protein JKJ11_07665 [Vibrio sp. SCSIO 43133]|uniref:HEPN domain-containing protein n=1 Tax=Vibrio sp. SCSIO 43133 TaxID=2802577 RepID=UPI00207592BA|nr:HEPN domain-containing protein [Vibrio sp. SCSIO 43133]USE01924.1 hypothetical protein JKJ11_07665 [Vibrio sp. SCSIO 43133]